MHKKNCIAVVKTVFEVGPMNFCGTHTDDQKIYTLDVSLLDKPFSLDLRYNKKDYLDSNLTFIKWFGKF